MVHWDEEGLTSVVQLSDVVEPAYPQKGSKAKVKWGRSIFPASILEIGSRKDVKKKVKDFLWRKPMRAQKMLIKVNQQKEEILVKARKQKERRCPSFVSQSHTHQAQPQISNAIRLHRTCSSSSFTTNTHSWHSTRFCCIQLNETSVGKVETLQMALQRVESFVSETFTPLQLLQDVHGAKVLELQNKLDNLECTAAAVNTSQQFSHLSPAIDHHQREILQDVTNVSVKSTALQICNTPARAQSQLKSAADVIGANSKLVLSVAKSGCLVVKLARESYFGEDVMCVSTMSELPKDKMKEIKARLYEVYRFDNLVEFEPLWQKCLTAIDKACQGLRAKDTICIP